MRTIEAQIPEPIYNQAQELALRENISIDQVISLAVTQTVSVWINQTHAELRSKENEQARFLDALSGVLVAEPVD